MEFVDQLNRTVILKKTPSRIVSLVPSQTELLVDLGLRNNIVGITKFCVHPKDLRTEKIIVGGTKKVNYNKIKSLRPDIIICNKEENTKEMVRQLEAIAPVWVSDVETLPDCLRIIDQLGKIFGVSEKALKIASKIEYKLKEFQQLLQHVSLKKVVYVIWKNPYMAAGKSTFINSLLKINRFENIVGDLESRYPEISEEDFKKADLILLSTEPYPFNENDIIEFQKKFKAEIRLVDGEYFSWYGSRLIEAFKYFKTIHN